MKRISLIAAMVTALSACSTPQQSDVTPTPEPEPVQTLASVRVANRGHSDPSFLLRGANRIYLGVGDYGLENVYSAPLSGASAAADLIPIRDTTGFHAAALGATALYGVVDGGQTALVACPLEVPCTEPRSIAQLESLRKYGFVHDAAVEGQTIALLLNSVTPGAGAIVTVDLRDGVVSAPLATFKDLFPYRILVSGGYVYYARRTSDGGSAGSTHAIERVRLNGGAPPESLVGGLSSVTSLAVDNEGIAFSSLTAIGSPAADLYTLALSGGTPTKLASLPGVAYIALTKSSIVVNWDATFVRYARADGQTLAQLVAAQKSATNLVVTDSDVLFGTTAAVTPVSRDAPEVDLGVARVALPSSK